MLENNLRSISTPNNGRRSSSMSLHLQLSGATNVTPSPTANGPPESETNPGCTPILGDEEQEKLRTTLVNKNQFQRPSSDKERWSDNEGRASSGLSSLASSLFGPERIPQLPPVTSPESGDCTSLENQVAEQDEPQFDFLKGVLAYVEVYSGSENRSECVVKELKQMGAEISQRITNRVTHCIFKDGKDSTYHKCRAKSNIKIVNIVWVAHCKKKREKLPEDVYLMKLHGEGVPTPLLGSKTKRMRSMQPKPFAVEEVLSADRLKQRKKRAEQAKVRKAIRAFDPFKTVQQPKSPLSPNDSANQLIPLANSSAEESRSDSSTAFSSISFDKTPEDFEAEMRTLRKKIGAIAATPMETDERPPSSVTPLSERVLNRLLSDPNFDRSSSPIPQMLSLDSDRVKSKIPVPVAPRRSGRLNIQRRRTTTPAISNTSDSDSSISLGPITLKHVEISLKKSIGVNTSDPRQVLKQKQRDSVSDVIDNVCKLVLSDKKTDKARSKRRLHNPNRVSEGKKLALSPDRIEAATERNVRKGAAKRSKELLERVVVRIPEQEKPKKLHRRFRSSVFVVNSASQRVNELQRTRESDEIESLVIRRPKKKLPDTERRGLAFTRLHREEQDVVYSATPHLGSFEVTKIVREKTTHVVCGDSQRSVTALMGIAKGAWLLPMKWVYDSIEAEEWLPESEYELKQEFPMAKVRRIEEGRGRRSELLAKEGPIYVGHGCQPPLSQLNKLIKMSGGKVASSSKRASVFVANNGEPLFNVEIPVVTEKWLIDSVFSNKVKSYEAYQKETE